MQTELLGVEFALCLQGPPSDLRRPTAFFRCAAIDPHQFFTARQQLLL